MRKLIILLLCCGVIVSMEGCGGNTAPPPTETTVSETVITKTLPVTAIDPTEKEIVTIESNEQESELATTTPTTTLQPTEETTAAVTIIAKEKVTPPIEETVQSITMPLAESETTVTDQITETVSEPGIIQAEFDVQYWISFAQEYAVSVGLILDAEAVSCWDNPIGAGAHCIYLERDIKSRLNRYAKDEDITDVWIWAEPKSNGCYDIYIGYA